MNASSQYDVIARKYAEHFDGALASSPFDVAILRSFARSVLSSRRITALDVGCGPGDAAAVLTAAGLDVHGVDAAPSMIDIARAAHPDVSFSVADMTALPFDDNSYDAVCAWYSIIHTAADDLAQLFTEFRRVLGDDGWLLLAFQTDAPTLLLDNPFGLSAQLEFLRHDVDVVAQKLLDCGYVLHRDALRTSDTRAGETASQAFIVARSADHFSDPITAPASPLPPL